jgi:hypothetical protein
MKIKKKISHYFIYLFVYFFLSSNAHAYLDPGTGSIILQAIIAFFAGAAAFVSFYWRKAKSYISNLFSKNKKKE